MCKFLPVWLALALAGTQLIAQPPATPQSPDAPKQSQKDYSDSSIVTRMMEFNKKKDGKLTKEEVTDPRLHRLFDQADINKDGKLAGAGIELYQKLLDHSPFIKLIASGGVSSMKDIEQLSKIRVEACVVGKAIYEGHISIDDVKNWNLKSLISI